MSTYDDVYAQAREWAGREVGRIGDKKECLISLGAYLDAIASQMVSIDASEHTAEYFYKLADAVFNVVYKEFQNSEVKKKE